MARRQEGHHLTKILTRIIPILATGAVCALVLSLFSADLFFIATHPEEAFTIAQGKALSAIRIIKREATRVLTAMRRETSVTATTTNQTQNTTDPGLDPWTEMMLEAIKDNTAQSVIIANSTQQNLQNLQTEIERLKDVLQDWDTGQPSTEDIRTIVSFYHNKTQAVSLQTVETNQDLLTAIRDLTEALQEQPETPNNNGNDTEEDQDGENGDSQARLLWYISKRSLYANETQYINFQDPGDLDKHLADIQITLDGMPVIPYSYRVKIDLDDLGLEMGEYSVMVKSDYYDVQNSMQTFTVKPTPRPGTGEPDSGQAMLEINEEQKTVRMINQGGYPPLPGTITWDSVYTTTTDAEGVAKWPSQILPGTHKLRGVPYDNKFAPVSDHTVNIEPEWRVSGLTSYGRLKVGDPIRPQVQDETTGATEDQPQYTIQFLRPQKSMGLFTIGANGDWMSFYNGQQRFKGYHRIGAAGSYIINVQTPDGSWVSEEVLVKTTDWLSLAVTLAIFPGFFPGLFLVSKIMYGTYNPKAVFTGRAPSRSSDQGSTDTRHQDKPKFTPEGPSGADLLGGG